MKRWLLLLAALVLPLAVLAHKPSDSYLTMRAAEGGSEIAVRWDIALRDLDYVLELDRDGDGALTWGEVRQRAGDIARYATSRLELRAGNEPCEWSTAGPLMLERHSDGTYAVLALRADCAAAAARLQARYSLLFDVDPSHRGLVQWIAPGTQGSQALIFGAESAQQPLPMQPPGPWQTLKQYVADGVWHIWIGFDHVLFLLALLLPSVLVVRRHGQWESAPGLRGAAGDVFKVVTAFTLAHSITLSLAALEVVSLPSRLVESAIAASVVLAALNNLRASVASRRWIVAFAFGLIHGFGFASVLADLGLPRSALVLALVGFNLGVELGQLAIVALFVPVAFALRHTLFYRFGVVKVGSILVALLAAWWFVQRAFDL